MIPFVFEDFPFLAISSTTQNPNPILATFDLALKNIAVAPIPKLVFSPIFLRRLIRDHCLISNQIRN